MEKSKGEGGEGKGKSREIEGKPRENVEGGREKQGLR